MNRSGWAVDRAMLRSLGIEARLVNDFQALAEGVMHATADDYRVLQEGKSVPGGTRAHKSARGHRPGRCVPGVGRASIPRFPIGSGTYELCAAQRHRAPATQPPRRAARARVSAERVVSGRGLVTLYEFLRPTGRPGSRSPSSRSPSVLRPGRRRSRCSSAAMAASPATSRSPSSRAAGFMFAAASPRSSPRASPKAISWRPSSTRAGTARWSARWLCGWSPTRTSARRRGAPGRRTARYMKFLRM